MRQTAVLWGVMKTSLLALLLVACGAPASSSNDYHVDECGSFRGRNASMAIQCKNGTDALVEAHCEIIGSTPSASAPLARNGWECAATWPDSNVGGSICVHLTCERNQ